jgi:drug/metabolite transporter (DMT)-like permease
MTTSRAQIRSLLRSGPVEIGGRPPASGTPPAWGIVLAFAAIYLIWGSTYLGIRYAVETIPPLLMMAVRHTTAGIAVYTWTRWRGMPRPTGRQWFYAVTAGFFLFLIGHGSLAWAEQKVPSGLAALLCSTLPLWMVLLGWGTGLERKLGARAWAGVVLGFAGVALLIGLAAFSQGTRLNLIAAAAVLLSSFSWAVGTLYCKSVRMPNSAVLAASMQMLTGGVWLFLAATVSGEAAGFQIASLTMRSALALLYLIVFGSIIAFTAFTWLSKVASPSKISTYAYVNPAVAVFVGWAVAGEVISWRAIVATAVILAGVALVTTRKRLSVPLDEAVDALELPAAVGE